ncbi:hypothetical protein [Kurthia gibsonii]|uniref:hypothetical protein n=1 Tax=Kurthia gibsonii TaxID=33946 RepID=UPI0031B73955
MSEAILSIGGKAISGFNDKTFVKASDALVKVSDSKVKSLPVDVKFTLSNGMRVQSDATLYPDQNKIVIDKFK